MVIVWGSRLMGKVDVVPGMFHVATKFGHLYYIPLIPTGSFVVFAQEGDNFRGAPIPLCFKSILFAWSRAILFVVAMIASIFVMVAAAEKNAGPWWGFALVAAGLWVIFGMTWHKSVSRASFARACQIARDMGFNAEGFAAFEQIYGDKVPRGFEVQKPQPVTAAATSQSFPDRPPTATAGRAAPTIAAPLDDDGRIPLEPERERREEPDEIGLR